MYLNTFENTFPKNKKIIYLKKNVANTMDGDNVKMVINFYAFLKTITALSISVVYKRKKI